MLYIYIYNYVLDDSPIGSGDVQWQTAKVPDSTGASSANLRSISVQTSDKSICTMIHQLQWYLVISINHMTQVWELPNVIHYLLDSILNPTAGTALYSYVQLLLPAWLSSSLGWLTG